MPKILSQIMAWANKHLPLLKGLFALVFGISLVYLSSKLLINLIVFLGGILLIYYGLTELKLRKITDFIDKMISKFKF